MTASFATEYAVRAWTRRSSGSWTDADESQLQAWLTAAPDNQAAYDKVARVWADTAGLAERFPHRTLPRRPNRRRAIALACVAAATAAVAIPLWRVGYPWWNGVPQHWSSARDKPEELLLADGTRVLLDAGSEIETRIGRHTRHVTLRRGEALFTVVHDATRPFEVESGSGKVTDLGTRFDIETVRDSTRVAVLEGRVSVSTSRETVALTAGQSSGYDRSGGLLPVKAASPDDSAVLWAKGKRRFHSEPLSDVLERLTRYHQVSFVFSEPKLQQLQVSGTFRVDDLSLFLRTLCAALPLETRQLGPQQIEIGPRANTTERDERERVGTGATP
jgi:transmembrane sensor